MKKLFSLICTFTTICAAITSCSKNLEGGQSEASLTDIKVEFSATMPEFKSGEILDTKASMESVVRIRWAKNDRLAVINLTTKKVLGGCMIADNNGINTTFSSSDLVGTIHAGDKFVFILDNQSTIAGATEKDFEPFTIDISSQEGNSDNVPIVVYAEYTATKDNEIEAVNLDFNYLVSYVQLAVAALPARTTITEISIDNIGNSCDFDITGSGAFKVQPKKGSITLTEDFSADGKGAKVRYFSCFESLAQSSAREAHITANGALHSTSWLKAGLSIGYYYQSVATGFTNENIQFADEAFKAYCVSHYDLNGDGELSFAEAAAVTEYADFSSSEKSLIKNVYELPYFPAELGLPSFSGCTALTQILIPGTVTSIPSHAFENCTSLTDISLPSGVNSIGENAFKGCSNLKSFHGDLATADNRFLIKDGHLMAFAPGDLTDIILPSNITVIDNAVFEGCSRLSSIVLPKSLITIGESAFKGCSEIKVMRLFENVSSIGNQAFEDCTSLTSFFSDAIMPPSLGSNVFNNCADGFHVSVTSDVVDSYNNSGWTSYNVSSTQPFNEIWYTTTDNSVITPSFYSIGANIVSNTYALEQGVILLDRDITQTGTSFKYLSKLKSISFPESVQVIDSDTFYGCSNLKDVTARGVIEVGDYSFNNCAELTTVSIPNVELLGAAAFRGCTKLSTIDMGTKPKSAGSSCFASCQSLTISLEGFSEVSANMFLWCKNLTIHIPASVKKFYSASFEYGSNISIYIDDIKDWCNMEWVDVGSNNNFFPSYHLYLNNELVEDIVCPDDLTSISARAFFGALDIQSIDIGDGVQSIGHNAFPRSATTFKIGNALEELGDGVFPYVDASIYVKNLKAWCLAYKGTNGASEDVCIGPKSYDLYVNNALVTDLVIPDGVTTVNDFFLYGNKTIRSVKFGENVTKVGRNAFQKCSALCCIELNNGIESIGRKAFYNCESLTAIDFPNTLSSIGDSAFGNTPISGHLSLPTSVTSMGASAFSGTDITSLTIASPLPSIEDCFYNCTKLKTVSLPEGMLTIDAYAFQKCEQLESITIPSSVKTIGKSAFDQCCSLQSIILPEGLERIANKAFYYTGLTSLTIPSTVTSIGNDFVYLAYSIKDIYCLATTPPTFTSSDVSIPLGLLKVHVPSSALEIYRDDPIWSNFSDYLVAIE